MSFFPFVILSTVVFSGIIFLLMVVLSLVEARIARKGNSRVDINDKAREFSVPVGKNLLFALSGEKIFLPSACGGGGTCGLCKCQVLAGGGDVLPTEKGLLTRKEQKNHVRLSCQVKIRGDLKIQVPEDIFSIKRVTCRVKSNRNVATFIKELVLEMPEPLEFKAGQYIQIYIPPYRIDFKDFKVDEKFRDDWTKYRLWDLKAENEEEVFRAYSMANYPAEKGMVLLNVRIATPPPKAMGLPPGIASAFIFNLKEGDTVDISGPYGDFLIKETKREMVYVGGGAGMAPMRSHLFQLLRTQRIRDRKISFWYGARSKREMFYAEDFEALAREFENFSFHVALSEPLPDDKWKGPTGFIHRVLHDQYLKNHEEPEEAEYYLCGPPVMIDAVQGMLDSLGVPPEMIAFDKFG